MRCALPSGHSISAQGWRWNVVLIQAASQLWTLPSLGNPGDGGIYKVTPTARTTSTIWPSAGNNNDGTPAVTTTYNSSDIQKWRITPL